MLDSIFGFVAEHEVLAYIVAVMGLFSFVISVERIKSIFFEYSLKTEEFMKQLRSLIEADKIEEAIQFCAANDKKPLAYVIKRVLEKADRDERAMSNAGNNAIAEVSTDLSKGMGYLSMIANVATLVGLVATIIGLIMSFKAVSYADPSQKQTLLAQGISTAMYTTALGLSVAIPTMVVYSFLHSRTGRLFAELDHCSGKVVDWLIGRAFETYSETKAFPGDLKADVKPAVSTARPAKPKVS
ncbi:MAG: MotA/TolQ/ExbB proton channel family protein [Bdellovibrionales bacterium CG10_big_fil_rev_8_21_14_0_10_45_34]|nr:MAG: MotA/TolQ/ExbB proton channel family protein [Bdellovibrionales bacterium CG10_big_fil_rev_8_21_14_0_10_45_34]